MRSETAPAPVAAAAAAALADFGLAGAALTPLASGVHATFAVAADAASGVGVHPAGGAPPAHPAGSAGEPAPSHLLRLYGSTHGADTVRSEALWLQSLRRDAGLLVPEPVAAPDGAYAVETAAEQGGAPRFAALFRWLDGQAPPLPPGAADHRRFGELLARLHRHAERFAPPAGFVRPRYDLDRLLGGAEVLARPAAAQAGIGDLGLLAAAAAIVRPEILALGGGSEVFGLVHGDLQVTNFLYAGGRVAAIDFADSGWGYYAYDLAATLLPAWGRHGWTALEAAFLRGYTQVRPLPPAQRGRLEAFLVARALFVLRWTAEFWHLPAVRRSGAAIVPHLQAQIRAFLARRAPAPAVPHRSAPPPAAGDAGQLLARLAGLGIRLWVDQGRLRFQAPEGALSAALRGELASRRAELVALLGGAAPPTAGPEAPPLVALSRDRPPPLSFAQQRLWMVEQMAPGNPAYNLTQIVCLRGALAVPLLARALAAVARRHEALRTTIGAAGGQPVQRIAPPRPVALPRVDLAGLPVARRQPEAAALADREVLAAFDLERGPLARFCLLRLGAADHHLLLTLHHIVSDGWSTGVLVRELALLYGAAEQGRPLAAVLPPLAVQYADFARWQRDWLQGEVLAAELDWWRERLAGAPDLLELPADRPRPPVKSHRGARLPLALPAPLGGALAARGRRAGATPFMVLVAVFATLLHRICGRDDMLIGSVIANRNRAEVEPLIGFFVNALVLRVKPRGGMTFDELLEEVRQTTLEVYQHQDLPFEKLVETLKPRRDPSQTPLFQVMLALQNAAMPELSLPGLAVSLASPHKPVAQFDLELSLRDGSATPAGGTGAAAGAARIEGSCIYSTDLFDAPTVQRTIGHFAQLAAAAAEGAAGRLDQLPMLSAAERHMALCEWNDTAMRVPHRLGFTAHLAATAARRPEAVAAVHGGAHLSYAALTRRAGALAAGLAARGVGPGELVALVAERGLDFLVAVAGILAAGGAYLPLNPSYPPRRNLQILEQSAAGFVLATRAVRQLAGELLERLAADRRPALMAAVEDLAAMPAGTAGTAGADGADGGPAGSPLPVPDPGDLAYVIYTSGSTGQPKGAMIEQRGFVNHLALKIATLGLGEGDRVAQTAAATFDISIWQLLAVLVVGGCVEIFSDEVVADAERLLAAVARHRVSVLEVVPSQLRVLLETIARRPAGLPLPELRWLIPNAETLPPELCAGWLARYPAVPMVNPYGATECSDDITHDAIRRAPAAGAPRVAVGRPAVNMRLYALDRAQGLLPAGVPGELWIGGIGVGRGYLGDAARTAWTFAPDPFGPPGARLYRTGDLGRQLAGGSFDFLGRLDHQVKVNGFRVEPGEIAGCLAAHPAVRESVVLVEPRAAGGGGDGGAGGGAPVSQQAGEPLSEPLGEQLVAYLTVHPGAAPNAVDLRRFLGERLPGYMVPPVYVVLPAMPISANGKIDRRALPAAARGAGARRLSAAPASTAPRTPLEEEVAAIWRQVLGGSAVGVEDRFFEVGGHSLLATTLMARVREAFQVEIPLAAFFREPTVAGLAEAVAVVRQSRADMAMAGAAASGEREEGEL